MNWKWAFHYCMIFENFAYSKKRVHTSINVKTKRKFIYFLMNISTAFGLILIYHTSKVNSASSNMASSKQDSVGLYPQFPSYSCQDFLKDYLKLIPSHFTFRYCLSGNCSSVRLESSLWSRAAWDDYLLKTESICHDLRWKEKMFFLENSANLVLPSKGMKSEIISVFVTLCNKKWKKKGKCQA